VQNNLLGQIPPRPHRYINIDNYSQITEYILGHSPTSGGLAKNFSPKNTV